MEEALEDRSVVILQTGRDHSLVLDLMEDHLAGQIHKTPLDLALDLMAGPLEELALGDSSVGILLTERDLSLVLDLMEDRLADQIPRMALDQGWVQMEDQTESPHKTVTHLGQDMAEILMGGKDHMIHQE